MNERVNFAHVLYELRVEARFGALALVRLRPGHIDEADLSQGLFLRVENLCQFLDAVIGNLDDADVSFLSRAVAADFCRQARQRIEDRRLARPRETYESYFHYSPLQEKM